jgi:hypothetical protein
MRDYYVVMKQYPAGEIHPQGNVPIRVFDSFQAAEEYAAERNDTEMWGCCYDVAAVEGELR